MYSIMSGEFPGSELDDSVPPALNVSAAMACTSYAWSSATAASSSHTAAVKASCSEAASD
ncbi:hypothetical protein SMC7_00730 [Candidatus Cryosericum terrychapinii]|uniref:Uncharacterized protein n=1 Tax=Candidatus Cryosericum terrychapinii TaxID=2290919 RepID=A0A398CTT4_9BACT|nr:hypothetical protein SMC7_00730 [Candidatus Cryosericum terrychapinii]